VNRNEEDFCYERRGRMKRGRNPVGFKENRRGRPALKKEGVREKKTDSFGEAFH